MCPYGLPGLIAGLLAKARHNSSHVVRLFWILREGFWILTRAV